jgi:hypothetical protein
VSPVTEDPTDVHGVYPYALDPTTATALWAASEDRVGEQFPS